MGPRTLVTAFALAAIVAVPAIAAAEQNRRPREEGQTRPEVQPTERAVARERAVPRTVEPQRRDDENRRELPAQRLPEAQAQRSDNNGRNNSNNGRYDNNNGRYNSGHYNNYRRYDRYYTSRIVRPTVVRVVPYRPYVYRPSYSAGVYYGSNGYYPYGYTPRGYFEPIPGRHYGGVRITGVPRDARVFADGYYVGIVNDFDGIFQHMNLEAGPHHVEIEMGGRNGIEFDVHVRPGETTTFRGDGYFGRY